MGVITLPRIDEKKYGELLVKTCPKVIETEEEFERMVALLEHLDFPKPPREITPEEQALASLLAKLIEDYDAQHHPIPEATPHQILQHLMADRHLRQADLVPVLGSRSQVSDAVSGKRGISKAQAKKLAAFFGVSAELFI